MSGLTALDGLGDDRYYVTIDTFQNNERSKEGCKNVTARLLVLFPNAGKSKLVWQHPVGNKGAYELRLGRNLSLTSAESFRRLASYGIANGNPIIYREQ